MAAVAKTVDEKIQMAIDHKEEGNRWLKEGNPKKASFNYQSGLKLWVGDLLPSLTGEKNSMAEQFNKSTELTDEQREQLTLIKKALLSNLALVSLRLERWDKTIEYSNELLAMEPANPKALFRRGKAWFGKKDLDRAGQDFEALAQFEPEDAAREMAKVKKELARLEQKESKAYSKMFE